MKIKKTIKHTNIGLISWSKISYFFLLILRWNITWIFLDRFRKIHSYIFCSSTDLTFFFLVWAFLCLVKNRQNIRNNPLWVLTLILYGVSVWLCFIYFDVLVDHKEYAPARMPYAVVTLKAADVRKCLEGVLIRCWSADGGSVSPAVSTIQQVFYTHPPSSARLSWLDVFLINGGLTLNRCTLLFMFISRAS